MDANLCILCGMMKTECELIEEERVRQLSKEGWSAEHDDRHDRFELTKAAMCYCAVDAVDVGAFAMLYKFLWPWAPEYWKPGYGQAGTVRSLVNAGALIAAEIDRINRLPEDDLV